MFSIMRTIERYIKIIWVFAYFMALFMDEFFKMVCEESCYWACRKYLDFRR